MRRRLVLGLPAMAAAAAAAPAAAQTWPTRAVRIVVPFGPGSGTDLGTRLLAQHLAAALGQPVIVENRPGATGTIAAQAVANAAPDGYTLLMGTNSTHGGNSATQRNLPYDPLRSFTPIAAVGIFPGFLVVTPSLPVHTPAELVAYGRANPGALTFATGNVSSLMMGEFFVRRLGIEAVRVSYPSNPQALTDVIAGRVSMMFPDMASSLPHVRAGRLRALATVTLGERSPTAPELPTVAETVLPGLHVVGWIGLFAPAATPEPVAERLSQEVLKVLDTAEMKEGIARIGAEPNLMSREAFRGFVRRQVEETIAFLAEIGVKPE